MGREVESEVCIGVAVPLQNDALISGDAEQSGRDLDRRGQMTGSHEEENLKKKNSFHQEPLRSSIALYHG